MKNIAARIFTGRGLRTCSETRGSVVPAWSHYQFNDSRLRHSRHALWFFPGQLKLRGTVQKRTFLRREIAIGPESIRCWKATGGISCTTRSAFCISRRSGGYCCAELAGRQSLAVSIVASTACGCYHRLPNFQLSPELVP